MALSIALKPGDPLPLYAQLERGIKRAIAAGSLAPGDQLPTVRQMAVELKVNANTVAKVYAELERQEVLNTRRGVGTFVAQPTAISAMNRSAGLRALAEKCLTDAVDQGFTPQQLCDEIQQLTRQP